ncbi:MAG: EAL domain-containing protein [Epulopiscium sp.]|nr:EAL domain-containing protein [Candidatus Epulonipiscium sp.]
MDVSSYQINQFYFLGTTVIIIIQILLIVFLLFNMIRRKKAEKEATEIKNNLQESYQELEATHSQLIASEQELHKQFLEIQQNREALRISRERYRLATEGAYDGIWDWDFITDTIFISSRGKEMLGFSKQQKLFAYEDFFNKIYKEDQNIMSEALAQHLYQEIPYFEVEQRMEIDGGVYQWFSIRGKAIFDKNGDPLRMAGSITNIHEHKQAEAIIEHMAYYDSLTGLPNRTFFSINLAKVLEENKKAGDWVAVFFVDIDNFKTVNDSIGHSFGDELLQQVAKLLKPFAQEDFCARLGGDEFVLILPKIQSKEEIEQVAKNILTSFEEPFCLDQREFFISVSIGIAVAPQDGEDGEILLKNADAAMYNAKQAGKNTYRRYDEFLHLQILKKIEMENDLRKAIEGEEFELYYQPQVDLKDTNSISVEALIRWNHPTKGMIPPGEFIELAEETGLIVPIGKWVLEEACKQMKQWKEQQVGIQYIAVNLSPRQFQDRHLIDTIEKMLQAYNLKSSDLEFEITETVAMEDIEYTIKMLQILKEMGFKISLDDFGTGYSSMNYLKKLPIDSVKIDRSFLTDVMDGDEGQRSIIQAVITLSHANDLTVVAEGVETKEQLDFLRKEHCDKAQGYFFSRPLPAEELEVIVKKYPFTK